MVGPMRDRPASGSRYGGAGHDYGASLTLGIVDDHPLFRLGLRRALEREPDLEIAWDAESAEKAMALLRESPVDLLLIDVSLRGGADGISATREIRRQWPELLVVVISALEDRSAAALAAGAAAFLPKHMGLDEMLAALRSLVFASGPEARPPSPGAVIASAPAPNGLLGQRTFDVLSPRERDVLEGIRAGQTNREIAIELGISQTTVNKHVHQILRKLRVRNRAQAAALDRSGATPFPAHGRA
jgi:DNA-binding NarL/FixJ family response regulator